MKFCQNCGHELTSDRCPVCPPGDEARSPYDPASVAAYAPAPTAANPYQPLEASAGFGAHEGAIPLALDAIPPAPRTPSKHARDIVFAYQGKQRGFLIMGIVFMAVGAITTLAFGTGSIGDMLLAMFGTDTQGTVIESHLKSNVRVNGVHPTVIRFDYKVAGTKYDGESSTLDDFAATLAKPGAPITVELLTSIPSVARARGTTMSPIGVAGLFIYIFPLVGLFMTLAAVRSNRQEIRAFVHGKPIAATVLSRGLDRTMKINGRNPMRLTWQFEVNGKSYKGDISNMNPNAFADLDGHEIPVLFDPSDPSVNTVYVR